MTDLCFILGKNWLLSIAELIVHLENRGYVGTVTDYSLNAVIINIEENLDNGQIVDMQGALGGCFKIGRVIWTFDQRVGVEAFPSRGTASKAHRDELRKCQWLSKIWHQPKARKIKFGVSTYPVSRGKSDVNLTRFTRGMDDRIKQILIEKGARKVDYFAYDEPDRRVERRPNVALWPKTIAQHNLLQSPNAEILAVFTEQKLYFAKTVVVYDSMLQQYRDESRPYISSEISTSPKICRTLLNLAGARSGDTVLDPFCGTGTLLMEAALLDMKCIGIDYEGDAVQGSRSNLKWLGRDLGQWVDFQIMKGNSRHVSSLIDKQVDAIAFEPHLGPVYKKKPSEEEAQATISELTDLYKEVLTGLASILRPEGRVGMTVPVIISTKGPVTVDLREMVSDTGFEIRKLLPKDAIRAKGPRQTDLEIRPNRDSLPERKRGQTVQRAIVMLGKT
ncbi:MAG: TRM11 family SAM-dependent methyltransferase [Candidatus Thorarchaeota archaeon]|jgi:tRNA G10  N-methylase Trm11